jgi:hypothetical protein
MESLTLTDGKAEKRDYRQKTGKCKKEQKQVVLY